MMSLTRGNLCAGPWAPLHPADEDVVDVMRKAKELQLERAEAMCVEHCRRRVSVHNAVAWFLQAGAYTRPLFGSSYALSVG
jgi:hypothetical protein